MIMHQSSSYAGLLLRWQMRFGLNQLVVEEPEGPLRMEAPYT